LDYQVIHSLPPLSRLADRFRCVFGLDPFMDLRADPVCRATGELRDDKNPE